MWLLYRRLLGIKDLMTYEGIRVTVMGDQPQIKYVQVLLIVFCMSLNNSFHK